jgi:hypothetical protein
VSAETSPLERATDAVQQRSTWPSIHWGMKKPLHPEAAAAFTKTALDAALDIEEMAKVIYGSDYEYTHALEEAWFSEPDETKNEYRLNARALRAHILGGAS